MTGSQGHGRLGAAGGGREPGRRLRAVRAAGRSMACLAGGSVLVVSAFSWYTYRDLKSGMTTSHAIEQVQQAAAADGGAPPHLDKSVNLLLIGLDSRRDQDGKDLPREFVADELNAGNSEIGGYNTNTLILMHIPADGGTVQAFSIPRDDYVDLVNVPGGHPLGKGKIKEAYDQAKYYAEQQLSRTYSGAELEHRGRDAGRAATLLTVQKLLDVPIDHFAELNLKGFYDVAKVLQPITVCLKKDAADPTFARTARTPGGGSGFHGTKGVNQLDASMALAFVRQRHNLPNGDLDRTHRQQAFLASVTTKLKQQGFFDDLGRLRGLLDAVKQDVVLDDQWDILDFAQQATNLTGGHTEFRTLPIVRYASLPSAGDVNIVDEAAIRATVRQVFQGGRPAASPGPSDQPAESATPDQAQTPTPSQARTPDSTPTPTPDQSASSTPAADEDRSAGDSVAGGAIPCVY
ncbi:LytR family transcriptional regulator [Streptomyces tateyamensis]|uniref:LytR family transcriptional regulator n=1 Tax=Streptomyces tateyamensis TaxID=565073 RepID=A0A2V4N3A3_9ACTN|nr:LCP family protein [Streptomyces tateyamensis]PYC77216.1 LytR family transcriptional regulator [Streptomyces tateyamensis]